MGRTIPSFRIAESQEIVKWAPFRRALPKRERKVFDGMMNTARLYVSASSAAVRTSKFEGLLMPIIFGHYRELQAILEEMYLIDESVGGKNEFR